VVATDLFLPIRRGGKVRLKEEDLMVEQLPLFLSLSRPDEISWRYRAEIVGPDGTSIMVNGEEVDGELLVETPVAVTQLPWEFPKIGAESLSLMISYLIPNTEGESFFNPSPWAAKVKVEDMELSMEAGEISSSPKQTKRKDSFHELKLRTGFYNPTFHFQNPLFVNYSKEVTGRSTWFSVESCGKAIALASPSPITLEHDLAHLRAESREEIVVLRGKNWKEVKPYRISWSMKNPPVKLDVKPVFNLSLYTLEPSSVVPMLMKFEEGKLKLTLVNMSDNAVMANFRVAARVTQAKVLYPAEEEIVPEFNVVKVPIRRWGLVHLELSLRPLLEGLLKRFIL
jgi:hypothetical protein